MKKRKICAFLLQLVIIATCVFCVSADNTVFAEEATDLQISVDKINCIVTVTNTKNGSVWTINPLNPQEDQYTTPATINDIRSQLVVTYYDKENKILFSGDTLFCAGFGRMDLPGGSAKEMRSSLKMLFNLPGDVKVYSGHGCETTIADERGRYRL